MPEAWEGGRSREEVAAFPFFLPGLRQQILLRRKILSAKHHRFWGRFVPCGGEA
jgi:hypothetical protein